MSWCDNGDSRSLEKTLWRLVVKTILIHVCPCVYVVPSVLECFETVFSAQLHFFRVFFVQHWSSVSAGQKYPEKPRGAKGENSKKRQRKEAANERKWRNNTPKNKIFGDAGAPSSGQKRKMRKEKKRGRAKSTRRHQKNRKDIQEAPKKKKHSVDTLGGNAPNWCQTSKLRPIRIFRLSRF